MTERVQVAHIVASTQAEGPGKRFAVWLQGCPMRCKGCCNPEMLPFTGGVTRSIDELMLEIENQVGIEGISLLGGEPFAQAGGAARLARRSAQLGLSVMIFSGFTIEELRQQASRDAHVQALLDSADLLVDGRFEHSLLDRTRRWIGSSNQRMHFLTDRYRADDLRFASANTIELRLRSGRVTVNGWPEQASALQRTMRRKLPS